MQFSVVHRLARDQLGEGPIWDERRGELFWVDIMGGLVHRFDPATERHRSLRLGQAVGWVLPRRDHPGFVAGLKQGFALLDIDDGAVAEIGNPEADRPGNRLNDAKVDAAGRLWAGTKSDIGESASGAFYRLDADLTWKQVDNGYEVTNGPAFSLDGNTLYHTDSAARSIFAFDLRPDGELANKRLWLRFEDNWGYPDGMTTDAEGCLWIAHWDGGRISCFSPEGKLMRSIDLPASNITSCAFGGENLDRLFVTSATLGKEHEKYAGSLFEVEPGVAGLPAFRFAG